MSLRINTQVYIPHLDKWGTISYCYDGRCQVKFTEFTDTSPYDTMYNEVNTYKTINNSRLVPYIPTNSYVHYSGLRGCILSSRYDADQRQFMYKIHVSAGEFPCYPTDYMPSDQEYTVAGDDLD